MKSLTTLGARLWANRKSRPAARRSVNYRRSQLKLESLERREVFAADVHPVFAPGTAAETMLAYDDLTPAEEGSLAAFTFSDSNRWSRTSTNTTTMTQGDPTVIRWSVVPDGTPVNGYNGEPAAPSNLRSYLSNIYGTNTASTRAQDQPWFSVVAQTFDRWSAVSGVTYVYEAADDGAALGSSASGVINVRGDVRLSGHYIDGPSNILAYNFYPTVGDMVIDTGDSFFTNTGSNSLRLRNTLAHELGHGLGLDHVTPTNGTKLMEPMISLGFDGPQADDILAVNRGYGDRLEKNGGNNAATTATSLGAASTFTVETVSIDDDSDLDWFQFSVGAGASLSVSLTPTGSVYTSGSTTFNSLAQSDLALAVYGNGGSTLIASANITGAGVAETLNNLALPGSGTYYVRISGNANAAQMYRLSGSITNVTTTAPEVAVNENGTNIADNTGAVSFGNVFVGASATKTFTVTNSGNANLTLGSTVSLPSGYTLVQAPPLTVLAPGGSTTFVVGLNTSVPGTYSGSVSLTTNDADENPFNFSIGGTVTAPPVTAPEIAVSESGANIADNTGAVSFGSVTVGGTATKTFTVTNSGNASLSLGAITLPTGFTLSQGLGSATLAAGASTTFRVQMTTTTAGTFSGQLALANDDGDENPFNFTMSGTVVAAPTTTTFSDNFNRANSSNLGANWTERAGNMSVVSSTLGNSTSGISIATVNAITSMTDAVLTANVNLGSGYTTRDSGLVARYSGSSTGSHYWGGLRYSGGRYYAEIWEANNGNWQRLSSVAVSSGSAALKFEVIGTSLKLYVNNVLTNSATDATLTAGRMGVSSTGSAPRLDNFTVSQPAALVNPSSTAATTPATSSPGHSAHWLAALDQLMAAWEHSRERRGA